MRKIFIATISRSTQSGVLNAKHTYSFRPNVFISTPSVQATSAVPPIIASTEIPSVSQVAVQTFEGGGNKEKWHSSLDNSNTPRNWP